MGSGIPWPWRPYLLCRQFLKISQFDLTSKPRGETREDREEGNSGATKEKKREKKSGKGRLVASDSSNRQQQHVCSAVRVYINTYKRRVNRRERKSVEWTRACTCELRASVCECNSSIPTQITGKDIRL